MQGILYIFSCASRQHLDKLAGSRDEKTEKTEAGYDDQ